MKKRMLFVICVFGLLAASVTVQMSAIPSSSIDDEGVNVESIVDLGVCEAPGTSLGLELQGLKGTVSAFDPACAQQCNQAYVACLASCGSHLCQVIQCEGPFFACLNACL